MAQGQLNYVIHTVPDGPPLNLSASLDSVTSIVVSWSPPDRFLQNGEIIQYIVRSIADSPETLMEGLYSGTLARLTGLEANKVYYISVSSRTMVGFGPYANTSAMTLNACKLVQLNNMQLL